MPRDFLSDNNEQQYEQTEISPRDFLSDYNQPNKENLTTSAILAIPRIGEDILKGTYYGIKKVPELYEKSKTEIPGAFTLFKEHPVNALSQLGAGFSQMGQNIFNTPHDIINYISQRLNLIPEDINKVVQMGKMPEDTKQMINQTFGSPNLPGEELFRGLSRNALNLMGVSKLASVLNPLDLTYKNIAKDIIKTGEKNKNIYNKIYNDLWKEAKEKGYYDMSHVVPKIDINTIEKFTPENKISRLKDFIKDPNVKNAHDAKSDLMKIKRQLDKKETLIGGERKQMKAITDAINDIQSNMFKTKKSEGIDQNIIYSNDLMDKYNKIQKGYANEVIPYQNKNIKKFKRNEISEKELINSLSQKEFAAKRGKYHRAMGIRKNILPIAGGAGLIGLGAGGKSIWDLLHESNK